MGVIFKFLLIYVNIFLMHFDTNSGHIVTQRTDRFSSEELRIKRQAGYVYDKPTVSFDLPTATSIATTQAPTVDRITMQMYYAYPVPAGGGDTSVVAQQNTGSSSGSSAVSSGGYSYGAQNTQVTDSRTTLTETQNTVRSGYQSNAGTGTQAIVSSSSTGYGDGRPISASNSAVTGTQTVVSSGSTGYGDGRPIATGGSVSTSAPRYLPPKSSGENTVGVSVTANTQTQTISQPSESYIPPTVQNNKVTITQSASAPSPPVVPNTSYLAPNTQSAPTVSTSVSGTTSQVQTQPGVVQSVPNVPTQQYLPPLESTGGQKTIAGPIAAPASTYLPPVF